MKTTTKKRLTKSIVACALAIALGFGTIFSGVAGVDVFAAVRSMFAPQNQSDYIDIVWRPPAPHTPLGSIHWFGTMIFGNFTSNYNGSSPGIVHMEGGMAVRGNMFLNNAYGDIGYAYVHEGHHQPDDRDPRLILGGSFTATRSTPLEAWDHRPMVLLLYGGDFVMRQSHIANITSWGGFQIAVNYEISGPNVIWKDNYLHGYQTVNWQDVYTGAFLSSMPVKSDGEIDAFFNGAQSDIIALRNHFATIGTAANPHSAVYRVSGFAQDNVLVPLPNDLTGVTTIVVDLDASSGNIITPRLDFSNDNINYILNVVGSGNINIDYHVQNIYLATSHTNPQDASAVLSDRIIWNFPGSGNITFGSASLVGSLLAPQFDLTAAVGGSVKGFVVVNNFEHTAGGFEQHNPSGRIRWTPLPWPVDPEDPPVVTTITTTTAPTTTEATTTAATTTEPTTPEATTTEATTTEPSTTDATTTAPTTTEATTTEPNTTAPTTTETTTTEPSTTEATTTTPPVTTEATTTETTTTTTPPQTTAATTAPQTTVATTPAPTEPEPAPETTPATTRPTTPAPTTTAPTTPAPTTTQPTTPAPTTQPTTPEPTTPEPTTIEPSLPTPPPIFTAPPPTPPTTTPPRIIVEIPGIVIPPDIIEDDFLIFFPEIPPNDDGYLFGGWVVDGVPVTEEDLPISLFTPITLGVMWIYARDNPQTTNNDNSLPFMHILFIFGFAITTAGSIIGLYAARGRYAKRQRAYSAYLVRKQRMAELGIDDYQE